MRTVPPQPRRGPRPQGDSRSASRDDNRPRRDDRPHREEDPRRPRLREPGLPDDIASRDLDRDARAELRSLPASLADKVAAHLIAAGRFLDEDSDRAREHAWYARHLAPRLAVTREA